MSFKLDGAVPWGRNIDEYREMFLLSDTDMQKKIAGFGDGPASFNAQASEAGFSVTSFDPIYKFTEKQLEARIDEVKDIILKQMSENTENYVWTKIKDLKQLENIRMSAMRKFLKDYERGRAENRYICHQLPDKADYPDNSFDIGLSSHFLLMYTALGYDFHIAAINEMLRLCKEVRIFPLCDLDGNYAELIGKVIEYFGRRYKIEIKETDYEFQKGASRLLVIGNG